VTDDPPAEVAVCRAEEVPADRAIAVADGTVLLARDGERIVAYRNRCLHQESPLDGGLVRDGVLTCPLHFWRYDLADGRKRGSWARLEAVGVRVADGLVHVSPPPPPLPISVLLRRHALAARPPRPTDD
jgi:nitrite reductase/ring-hydroxylating ferredoxin subunit